MRPKFEFRTPPSAQHAPRPQLLTASWMLWLLAGLGMLVAVVLPLLGVGEFQDDLRTIVDRDFPNEAPATRDRVIAMAGAVLVGSGIVLALLEVGFAAAMHSGRGGARIVLALLVVPVLLHAWLLISVAAPPTVLTASIGTAAALTATVLMFLPGNGAWLARRPSI